MNKMFLKTYVIILTRHHFGSEVEFLTDIV